MAGPGFITVFGDTDRGWNSYLCGAILLEMDTPDRIYFDNAYKELVNFFVEQKKLSAKELKEIITMIEQGK